MSFRFVTLMLAAAAFSCASARTLTPAEALGRVDLSGQSSTLRAPAAGELKLTRTINVPGEESPALYLFSDGGAMMIVSADDQAAPLLGFTEAETQGEMPPQMEWWLSQYARQIEHIRLQPQGLRVINPATAARAAAARADRAPIPQQIKTVWNQDAPFNNLCPKIGSRVTYTGCVATAAAQVMNYFNWPDAGTGTITYTDGTTRRTLALDGKTFDWANMKDSYNGSYTSTQANAVAYLMQACGYAAHMNYGTDASGAQSTQMLAGAVQYLKYNTEARCLDRDIFSPTQWEEMVYENLSTVGPVYYAGNDGEAGHAFVCDGYRSNGYFHFNWGWGGAYDGFFLLDALNPEGQGIGGNTGGFNYGQEAFFNFTKPGAQTIQLPETAPFTQLGNLTATTYNSGRALTFTSDAVDTYGLFCYNTSGESSAFDLAVMAVSDDGGYTVYGGVTSTQTMDPNYGFKEIPLTIPTGLANGTYDMQPVCRKSGTSTWLPMNHTYGCVDHVTVTVRSGRVTSVDNNTPGSVTATELSLESTLSANNSFRIRYTAANYGSTPATRRITPCVAILNNAGNLSLIGIGEELPVTVEPGATTVINQTSTLSMGQGYESYTGSVYLCLIDNDYSLIDYIQAQMVAGKVTLEALKFSFVGNASQAVADNLRFDCSVKCTSGNFSNPLSVYITSASGNSILGSINSEQTFFISAGETASAVISGSFSGGSVGESYTAHLGYVSGASINSIAQLSFTIAAMSGVEAVAAGNAGDIAVTLEGSTARISAPSAIASVEIYGIDGRRLAADIDIDVTAASASGLPAGVLLVKVTLADGTAGVTKLVR